MAKLFRKKTTKTNASGERVTIESKRWYGSVRQADGKYRQTSLTESRDTSFTMLRRLQSEQDTLKAAGLTTKSRERTKPLSVHLGAYKRDMESRGNTPKYTDKAITRIERVLRATKATHASDLSTSKISDALARWRSKDDMAVETSNHYVRAVKGFARWMWMEEITDNHLLRGLKTLNARADRRRVRRALSDAEFKTLLETIRSKGETIRGRRWSMTPEDRVALYSTAAMTGLRCSELASLTTSSVDLEQRVITIEAAYAKNRRTDTLPLHDSLVEVLRPFLAGKEPGEHLWPGPWAEQRHGASILKRDLAAAGIPYVDDAGRYADFHALRHGFISSLARNGVHPKTAQALARHSSITLTMDVYSHLETDQLREALATLPGLTDSPAPPKECDL